MADHFAVEDIAEFKEAFTLFDADNSGNIAIHDLGRILRSLGRNPTCAELQGLLHEVDADGTGVIDFPNFLRLLSRQTHCGDIDNEISYFQRYDKTGSGFIALDDLWNVFDAMGEKFNDSEVLELAQEAFEGGVFCLEDGGDLSLDFLREEALSSFRRISEFSQAPAPAQIVPDGDVEAPRSTTIRLKVLALSGAELTSLSAEPAATVRDLRGQIQLLTDIPASRQELVFNNVSLKEAESLTDAGLVDDVEVTLVKRMGIKLNYTTFLKMMMAP